MADADRRTRHRRAAAAQRLRVRVAAAAGVSVGARGAAHVRQHAAAARRGGRRARGGARRLCHGEVLRRGLSRAAARGRARRRPRRGLARARRAAVAGGRAASRSACCRRRSSRCSRCVPEQLDLRRRIPDYFAAGGFSFPWPVARPPMRPLVFLLAIVADDRHHRVRWCSLFYHRRVAAQRALGLRFRAARCAHAGHRGRLRPADPPHLRCRSSPCSASCRRRSIARRATASWSATGSGGPVRAARRLVQRVADAFAWLQQGRIATYLLYSFVTLLVLLALVL